MKLLAGILMLVGISNLFASISSLHAHLSILTLWAGLIGISALLVAAGILRKKSFAIPCGYVFIAAGAIYWLQSVVPFALRTQGSERMIQLIAFGVGACLVAVFFGVLWYRQRKYFEAGR